MEKDTEEFDDLIFEALVFIVGLISDIKYQHFRPVLDAYIKENFSATLAYSKLLIVLKKYIDSLADHPLHEAQSSESLNTSANNRPLSATSTLRFNQDAIPFRVMKSLEYLFRFIVRSRILFATLNGGKGRKVFEESMKDLLESLVALM